MAITAKELAGILGLSPAAVSLALNNKPGVSNQTRKRVWEAARAYDLEFTARGDHKGNICLLIYRRSGAIVSQSPFFQTLTDGIALSCRACGYQLVMRYAEKNDGIFDAMRGEPCSGVIALATEMQREDLQRFTDSPSQPLVVLDTYCADLDANYVLINNDQGAYLATSSLLGHYHGQPGYLKSSYRIGNFEQRADGFYKAIRAWGLPSSRSPVHLLSPSQEGARDDMAQLLVQGEEPARCYFADNDDIAIGAMSALQAAGYKIPEDVAIIGFDDLPQSACLDPPLTTVHVPTQYMGQVAVRRLVECMEQGDTGYTKVEIGTHLEKRRSAL